MRRLAARQIDAGLSEVLKRIQQRIRLDSVVRKLTDKVMRFFRTKDKSYDLTNSEATMIYDGIKYDEKLPLSSKKDVSVEWTNHAKWRSDLRDVDPKKVNEMVQHKLKETREKDGPDRGDVRLKSPGIGTAVVVYDNLKHKGTPAEADVVTTWK